MYKDLCADDEKNILQYLPIAIRWEDLQVEAVRTASSTREALHILETEDIDIVISDVEMPGVNGLSFCRKAMERKKDLKNHHPLCL